MPIPAWALLLAFVALAPATSRAQEPVAAADPAQASAPDALVETTDVFDLLRRLRHKELPPDAVWDYRKPMKAFAPVIGAKPANGVLLGVAGNVAFYRGEPTTTHISSAIATLTFSTKGQTSLTDRFTIFTRDDRWRIEGDQRAQWTSLETYALGTGADTSVGVQTEFDYFRLHHTV